MFEDAEKLFVSTNGGFKYLINGQIVDENHQGNFGKMKIKEIKNNKNE